MTNLTGFLETLKQLYAVESLQGYAEKEIESLKQRFGSIPQILEDYYRTGGRTYIRGVI